jgi:nitrilase
MKRVAAIQMASGPNVSANLTEAGRLISRAVDAGAELVALPENFALMGMKEADKVAAREAPGTGPIQHFLAEQADKHRVWIIGGTVPLQADSPERIRAACLAYDASGQLVGRYDKMHLFDVRLRDGQETYTESETIEAGRQVTVFDSPFGRIGLAVCYDLRFPELFRRMADQGVDIIAVPSAFTAITGKAHWEVLVRARAIENLAYVIAPDQGGFHINGRETYGNSMIVDPWGVVLDRLPSGSGYVIAELDTDRITNTREHFPALLHRRSTEDLAV